MLPNRQDLIVIGGAAVAAGVVLWLVAKNARAAGQAAGQAVGDLASGAVMGLGASFGLPDTTDANVIGEGRAALDEGNYFEASKKLPAGEFLSGVGSQLGLWWYDVTHPGEGVKLGLVSNDMASDRANYTDL